MTELAASAESADEADPPGCRCNRCSDIPDHLVQAWRHAPDQAREDAVVRLTALHFHSPEGLTPSERRILLALRLAAPNLITHAGLLERDGLTPKPTSKNALRIYIQRLRQKIESLGYKIETVYGDGYRLVRWPS